MREDLTQDRNDKAENAFFGVDFRPKEKTTLSASYSYYHQTNDNLRYLCIVVVRLCLRLQIPTHAGGKDNGLVWQQLGILGRMCVCDERGGGYGRLTGIQGFHLHCNRRLLPTIAAFLSFFNVCVLPSFFRGRYSFSDALFPSFRVP